VEAIGIYFSAHWCPPCRGFTPKLCEKYLQLKAAGKKVEMIFVSSDRDDDAFSEYFATMPFLALPFVKRHLKAELSSSSKFDVSGIPSLIFIDGATGVTITKNGRAGISAPTFIENFPYYPKPSYDLSETTDDIQDHPSLIVLCEDSENEIKDTISTLTNDVALEMKESGLNDELRYFTGRGGGPLGQIKGMCGFPVVITPHEHALVEKENTGGWYCDGCRGNTAESSRYRCGSGCDFDYCQNCECCFPFVFSFCCSPFVVLLLLFSFCCSPFVLVSTIILCIY